MHLHIHNSKISTKSKNLYCFWNLSFTQKWYTRWVKNTFVLLAEIVFVTYIMVDIAILQVKRENDVKNNLFW